MGTHYRPDIDAEIEDSLIEVKSGTNTVRNLQTGLLKLAYALLKRPLHMRGFLVLADPKITEKRLEQEWNNAKQVLRSDVIDRLSLVLFKDGQFRGLPEEPSPEIRSRILQMVHAELKEGAVHLPRRETYYEILKIIIHQWLLNKGPMTADWLGKAAGCSYPTVAAALHRLGSSIKRHSDRRVELTHFPRDEWAKLMAVSDRVRSTMRFADRSGQPRSPDSLLHRLRKIERRDIAVGGVFGARHYYPPIDLIGSPRLDLSIHSPGGRVDLGFVERLDPALHRVEDSREPANMVIHFVRRNSSLFEEEADGWNWADPVDCLLDLHEVRLESQAVEFLDSFKAGRVK